LYNYIADTAAAFYSLYCLKIFNSCILILCAHLLLAGRMVFKNSQVFESIQNQRLVAMQYTDDEGMPTTEYPMNPNGSAAGIAGLCSTDGRHLAMMPHPERCVCMWQWPWMPQSWRSTVTVSPWLCMFKNAFDWCVGVRPANVILECWW